MKSQGGGAKRNNKRIKEKTKKNINKINQPPNQPKK